MRESGAETRDRSSVPPSIWVASLLLSNLMVGWSANCRARCLLSLLVVFEPRREVCLQLKSPPMKVGVTEALAKTASIFSV